MVKFILEENSKWQDGNWGGEVRARGFQWRFSRNYGEVVSMFNDRNQKTWCGPTVAAKNQIKNPLINLGVSKNGGTPKWMVYDGKPYKNG